MVSSAAVGKPSFAGRETVIATVTDGPEALADAAIDRSGSS